MTNTKETASTIIAQLGRPTLAMLGAKNLMAGDDGLRMKLGNVPKGITHLRIALAADDTFIVEATRMTRDYRIATQTVTRDVYANNLHSVIESMTGLYTRL